MGWKTVELQIEALVPGILLLLCASLIYESPENPLILTGDSFIDGAFFVGTAYALGLVLALISRAVVDWLSERGPRAIVFSMFAHLRGGGVCSLATSIRAVDEDFNGDLTNERTRRIGRLSDSVACWNAVYRWALRNTTRVVEVDRRRSQGRIVRNLMFPAALLATRFGETDWTQVAWALGTSIFFLFLYAYAEYINFAEAYDISKMRSRPREFEDEFTVQGTVKRE